MTSLRRILRALDDEDRSMMDQGKKRRRSPSPPAYVFADEDDEAQCEEALRAVAALAGSVDDAIQRIEAEGAHPETTLRAAVAPYLAAAEAHDAALRAFFADFQDTEEHVPTVGLWALAAVARVCPARALRDFYGEHDDRETARFVEQAEGYFAALRAALYTRRPGAFYARRPFVRSVGARLEDLLEQQGGCDARTWLRGAR